MEGNAVRSLHQLGCMVMIQLALHLQANVMQVSDAVDHLATVVPVLPSTIATSPIATEPAAASASSLVMISIAKLQNLDVLQF